MFQYLKVAVISLLLVTLLFLLIFFLKKKILFKFIFFNVLKSGIILTIVNFIGIYFPKITIPISALSLLLVTFCGVPGVAMVEIFKIIF